MLRIKRVDNEAEQRTILEGRLTQSWFADLKSYWQENRHDYPKHSFVVHVNGVVRVDCAGEHGPR
jgi:hypothetical protein